MAHGVEYDFVMGSDKRTEHHRKCWSQVEARAERRGCSVAARGTCVSNRPLRPVICGKNDNVVSSSVDRSTHQVGVGYEAQVVLNILDGGVVSCRGVSVSCG